jgi:hypothetical protein
MVLPLEHVAARGSKISRWLAQPMSTFWCVMGWCAATAVFVGLTRILGGPTENDAAVSVYSTWAIAHGHLACAYSPGGTFHIASVTRPYTQIAPLYPLYSGIIAFVTRIGHSAPFPSIAQLGSHCLNANAAIYGWAIKSNAIKGTTRIGYLAWPPLMFGAVSLLRTSNVGRQRRESLTLILIACCPPVFMCLVSFFHPQDLLAMGLALFSLALTRRAKWIGAGFLIGLAFAANQFALLVAIPVFVVMPSKARARLLMGMLGSVAIVDLSMIILTSGRALRATVIGSGFTPAIGGTLLWATGLHGSSQFVISRALPLALAFLLSAWAVRQLGLSVLEPVPLCSLVATCLMFRLVFEENLIGYYFMATAVLLIVLDAARRRFRGQVLAWLALVALAFNPVPWGFDSNGQAWGITVREGLPNFFMAVAVGILIFDWIHHRIRWYVLAWLMVVVATFFNFPWLHEVYRRTLPTWLWQIILIPLGMYLVLEPLVSFARDRRRQSFDSSLDRRMMLATDGHDQ